MSISPVRSSTNSRSASASPTRSSTGNQQILPAPVKNDNIKVIARFRPDESDFSVTKYHVDGQTVTIGSSRSGHEAQDFIYDRVFDESTQQEEIFDYSIRQTTDDLAEGYNGTVLCYGQTGAGKSYTVMGDLDDEEEKGLIPRIFERIFEIIEGSPKTLEYTVGVSYLEVYNEYLRDLLDPQNNKKLAIRENRVDGVYVSHLETFYVANLADVYTILREGSLNRTTGATKMNNQSSRSHAIFQIKLSSKDLSSGIVKTGNLFLVDLAGSEKIDKTGVSGQLLEEAKKINSSLSALGNVINSLTDGKSRHIPYRDSKLTRILQESLGGNSRTTLIINCSPSAYNEMETMSTLRFGSRAKRITNSVHVNSDLSTNELKKRYLEQIKMNGEQNKRLETMETRIRLLEEENSALKEEIKRYTESETPLPGKELLKKFGPGTDAVKLATLQKALKQFGSQIDQVDSQNSQLRKDVESLKQISELKDTRIEELQERLSSREVLVAMDSSNFENKLGYLKTRMSAAKRQAPKQLPVHKRTVSQFSESSENSVSDKENSKTPRKVSGRRMGLNLRIVKPMRGGQDDDDQE
ncbi:DEKNAAC103565 [Brettanomyces naardenensis]|uniref:DEKNAAC103565 n=1 Tax=Brettanomyces naardenensis TaxID=13370 RepID=A0A448YNM3_BRENA|nr:DEKNAAC103565 [Brettanomyces naardenensis]